MRRKGENRIFRVIVSTVIINDENINSDTAMTEDFVSFNWIFIIDSKTIFV